MELSNILPRLEGVRKTGNGYVAFCPAHKDISNRSLSVTEHEGKLLMHCFCGCSFGDILKAMDITPNYIEPELEAIYDYTDEEGNTLFQVLRFFPKSFKQRQTNGDWNLNGVRRVLFQLPKVLEAKENNKIIYFVEGEKDCINLAHYGIAATSISGGAQGKWLPEYTNVLEDTKVAIIPDNDEPGRKHAERVANLLYGWAKSVRILELGSRDTTEWLKTRNTDELEGIYRDTLEWIPMGAVTREEFNQLKGHIHYIQDKFNEHLDKPKEKGVTYKSKDKPF